MIRSRHPALSQLSCRVSNAIDVFILYVACILKTDDTFAEFCLLCFGVKNNKPFLSKSYTDNFTFKVHGLSFCIDTRLTAGHPTFDRNVVRRVNAFLES